MSINPFKNLWRKQPDRVSTDTVIPLRFWDDLLYNRSFLFDFTLRFDDILDVTNLEWALDRLMTLGNWGQLGARLRLNKTGRLEYHIPTRYDTVRPAFHFTTAEHAISIDEHPLACGIPRVGSSEHIYPGPGEFASLLRHPNTPRCIDDYIYSDIPQLHIHIVLFHDATLITLTHLHTLFDASSRGEFLKAWASVIAGREEEVKPLLSFDHDPLATLGMEPNKAQQYTNYDKLLTGLHLITFYIYIAFNLLWYWRDEEHQIRLPGHVVERMRRAALAHISKANANPDTPDPFLSEGDIILAWWLRTMTKTLPSTPTRTISIMNVFSIRPLFPNIMSETTYTGNAFSPATAVLNADEVLRDDALARTASTIRLSLLMHRTLEQVDALASIQRTSKWKIPAVVGNKDMQFFSCSDTHRMRFFELDFSPAVVSSARVDAVKGPGVTDRGWIYAEGKRHLVGRPTYINDGCICSNLPNRDVLRVLGRDGNGDWWLALRATARIWGVIREEFEALEWLI